MNREEFEKWLECVPPYRSRHGDYISFIEHYLWEAWQHQQKKIAKLEAECLAWEEKSLALENEILEIKAGKQ